jgi:hypothetical protein
MKKLSILALLCLGPSFISKAQFERRKFKPFKTIASMGWAKPENLVYKYPLNFSLEPKYGPTDWLWFGLRGESTLFIQESLLQDDYKAFGVFSVVPHVELSWPINDEFRPFIGFGYGLYASRLYFDGYEEAIDNQFVNRYGFSPRIGFEWQRSTVALEYNLVKNGLNYLAFKIGYCMWGGTVD